LADVDFRRPKKDSSSHENFLITIKKFMPKYFLMSTLLKFLEELWREIKTRKISSRREVRSSREKVKLWHIEHAPLTDETVKIGKTVESLFRRRENILTRIFIDYVLTL
jgi:hypothetical protein